MKNRVRVASAFVVLLVGPSSALADDEGIKKAADKLLGFGHAVAEMKSNGTEGRGNLDPDPSKCSDALAEAEKAGATDETRLYAFMWPNTLPSYHHDSKLGSSITLAAARGVCADYAIWRPALKSMVVVKEALAYLRELDASGTASSYAVDAGKACLEVIDRLDAASRTVEVKMGTETMTLDGARARCQDLLERSGNAVKQQAAASGAKRAEIEAKWKKAGMKGDRLKLFVDNELNGGGFPWYAKGCTTEISDPKKLAKAKTLFMWTAGGNGGTLVSKYVFKGNKYKETSREYFDEAKAYRGCK